MADRSSTALHRIRGIADYQFGRGAGLRLFPDNVTIVFSKRTGKIRQVYNIERLLATLRPRDGLFSLTIEGAKRLIEIATSKRLSVQVQKEAVAFVEKGGDVFAKHVVHADEELRPGEEVIVLNGSNRIVAVGRAMLSGDEMKDFKRGIAVKVRRGDLEKVKKARRKR
jgi:predicted RNA-binding protein (TIGR00451 family)